MKLLQSIAIVINQSLNPVLVFLPLIAVGGNTVELRFMTDFKLEWNIACIIRLSISTMMSSPLYKLEKVAKFKFGKTGTAKEIRSLVMPKITTTSAAPMILVLSAIMKPVASCVHARILIPKLSDR